MKLSRYTNKAKRIKINFIAATLLSCGVIIISFPWFGRILKKGFADNYYTAYVNGVAVGSSTDKDTVETALKNARMKINEQSRSMQFLDAEIEIKESRKIVGETAGEEKLSELAYDALKQTVDDSKKKAYVVDIGGYVVTLGSLSEVEYFFNAVKDRYNSNPAFNTNLYVEDNSGHTTIGLNISRADVQAVDVPFVMAGSSGEGESAEQVTDMGESIINQPDGTLDMKFEQNTVIVPCYVSSSQIDELNAAIDMVTREQSEPELSVIVNEKQTYTVEYTKETEYVYNEKLYNTEQRVLNEGSAGTKELVADVVYKNGVEISRNILSETVTNEATATVIEVGTAVPPTYIKPISGGTLSSTFGERWGSFHKGVDWACSVGTEVMASCKGTVIQAGWVNGYGYCITLKHADGKSTRYGHLSRILVSEGQSVEQSELIALSGNTGNSTGPHVHFEIIENGVQVNPFGYLN